MDGDGLYEVLLADYTGGGRVHVIENNGPDTWELVYSTPFLDSTATTSNIRTITGGDVDGDGHGEIMFFGGRGYSESSPYTAGLYFFEHTGADNDYGSAPAAVYDFGAELPDRQISEQLEAMDVDGDGSQEIMWGNNGGTGFNQFDSWYVLSVTGDIGSGFETFVEEARWTSRADDPDPINRGGGSAYGIVPADLDGSGDGLYELSMGSWNNFNFTNAAATGADTYTAANDDSGWYQACDGIICGDHVALFGGAAGDVNGDGDDEAFWPRYNSFGDRKVSMLNYEAGENVLAIDSTDHLKLDFFSNLTNFGVVVGDFTGDGYPDVIGAGNSYIGSDADEGAPSSWINVAAYIGPDQGNVEDTLNWDVRTIDTSAPADTWHHNTVNRDSAGTMTTYSETALGKFTTKLAYLGDADMDGWVEVAMAFQSVPDSISTIDEVWNADSLRYDRTVASTVAAQREFMRIVSTNGFNTAVEDTRIVLPQDYKLFDNYPNPFNPTTTIGFDLPLDKQISVSVYDISGRLVKTLVNNELFPKGVHEVTWDGRSASGASVASGTYLYTLEYGNFRQSKTMTLVK
ncbi:MAG: T9SS type A sorting domain-containing protein [Rhodothermales bacterium]|nr:T9SS type A sorting domain-containing protein [Rhodothermales bacterium]